MLFVCCGALDLCTADLKCIIVKAVRHVLELALLLVCTSYHKYIFLFIYIKSEEKIEMIIHVQYFFL